MNERKVTKRKHSLDKKKKEEQAEVFILPPNLLEQLGINLGSIEAAPEFTNQEPDKDSLSRRKCEGEYDPILSKNMENHQTAYSETESSILKTANLMKDSVFLSPTFNLNTTIQNEMVVDKNINSDIKTPKVDDFTTESFDFFERSPSNILPTTQSISGFENIGSAEASMSSLNMNEVDESNYVPDIKCVGPKETLYDEHADEAYSSDCSNSQIDKAEHLNSANMQFSNESKINKNKKINIISEEIIDLAQFKKIDKCRSPTGNNLIPVTINTVINTQYKNSISYGQSINGNLCPDLITDCLKSCETFDRKSDTLLENDDAIRQIPEINENSVKLDTNQLSAHTIQEHDKDLNVACSVDNIDRVDLVKPDVIIETSDNSVSNEVFEERKDNETFKNVKAIASDVKCDTEIITNTKYKNNKNSSSTHTEDKINSTLFNDHAEDNPSFIKNRDDSELDIKEQNTENKTKISSKSLDTNVHVCTIRPEENELHRDIKSRKKNCKSKIMKSQNETNLCNEARPTLNSKEQSTAKSGAVKNANDLDIEKVKEIAKYLTQFAEIKKRKVMDMKNSINSAKAMPSKEHSANSLTYIQGVEKPGGFMKTKKAEKISNIRTYARKQKCISTIKIISQKYPLQISTKNIDLMDKNSANICNETEFCLCNAFGQLMSYNIENVSEIICVCKKSTTVCTPDIVFSIYYERSSDATFKIDDFHRNEEYPAVGSKENSLNKLITIDMNDPASAIPTIDYDANDKKSIVHKTNNLDIDEEVTPASTVFYLNRTSENNTEDCDRTTSNDNNVEPGATTSNNKQIRKASIPLDGEPPTKKRVVGQRSLSICNELGKESEDNLDIHAAVFNDSARDEVASVENDLTKCGVCGKYMQCEDWFSHIETEHNYLAWKYGDQALDVNKTEVVGGYLGDILKEHGGLKCMKCGIIRRKVNTYMKHIEICNGFSKPNNDSIQDTSMESLVRNIRDSISDSTIGEKEIDNNKVKCGVCGESMCPTDWLSHRERHHYLAWKSGEPVMDLSDNNAVREHLYNLVKEIGELKCFKCGIVRKYVKAFMTHIQSCDGKNDFHDVSALDTSYNVSQTESVKNTRRSSRNSIVPNEAEPANSGLIKCGVCDETMDRNNWFSHIESQHDYLAWKSGEPILNVNNEVAVLEHLHHLVKEFEGLKCKKCGLVRKYAKSYLNHIEHCNGPDVSQNVSAANDLSQGVFENKEIVVSRSDVPDLAQVGPMDGSVKCAVCGECMKNTDWYIHIESQHDYLAWKFGEPALNMNDKESFYEHLYEASKKMGALKCSKCGLLRKYVKAYLKHFENCIGQNESSQDTTLEVMDRSSNDAAINSYVEAELSQDNEDLVKCGVCADSMRSEEWICHIKKQHNYLAWKCGEPPLNVDDVEAVREHFHNIVKKFGVLECSKCGIIRKYVKSYLSHFNDCDGLQVTHDPENSSQYELLVAPESASGKVDEQLVKCGTCGQYMVATEWMAHLTKTHNYLAWKSNDKPVDVNNPVEVQKHLKKLVDEIGSLVCRKCGRQRKYVKSYLEHIRTCDGSEAPISDVAIVDSSTSDLASEEVITPTSGPVPSTSQCGVCGRNMQNSMWIIHIVEEHDYLAWKEGEPPLDVNDKAMVRRHLARIAKECGALTCKTCGKTIQLAKTYLQHIEACGQDANVSVDTLNSTLDVTESVVDMDSGGTCGVCKQAVEPGKWIHHTQKYHNYLAWRDGEKPWDVEDYAEVNQYLYEISKRMKGLTCNKCGLVRKYVKSYLTHIKNCDGLDFVPPNEGVGPVSSKDGYECAMCRKKIEPTQWRNHAMSEHYNVTWVIGQTPIDIKNPYAVEKYLREYGDRYGLKCKCGTRRASVAGFYAHIITCGKTEEEIEMYKNFCEICNNTYLCIYKNQHTAMHRVQEYSKEQKLKKIEAQNQVKAKEEELIPGKRRAAQKARSVIENYKSDLGKHTYKCDLCNFGTEFKEELKSHKCDKSNAVEFSGDDSSSGDEEPSGDESAESSLESEHFTDEEEPLKKRFRPNMVTSKVARMPFVVQNQKSYLLQADKDFCDAHFSDDTLFREWRSCDQEMVAECDLPRYLPPMEYSCKVKSNSDWRTLRRFEALKAEGVNIFVGACIISIAWAPLRVEDLENGAENYLAIACHNDVDVPRYRGDETPSYENLIQIWDFTVGNRLPKIGLGIAHDFGTVWSMAWCPSGARDPPPAGEDGPRRLGLLAVACSNGSAYVFSVPYPSTVVKDDKFIYKLKPVAELRMQMSSDRKSYQATAITWSKEREHNMILVGYGDGSTGYYDLSSDSPLLRKLDNGVHVYYPYHDERPYNTCITGVDTYPSALRGGGGGGAPAAVCAGATGAELGAARRGAGGGRARFAAVGHAAAFAPLWPAAMLAGDADIMRTTVNELEWTSGGRRVGGVSALAGCARCADVAAAAPPTLRLMRTHPVYPEVTKQVIGLVELSRLDNKKAKAVNDELAVQVEPITYADTVKIYGIEFRTARKQDKAKQQEFQAKPSAHYPERFPLAEVRSMAFCPSRKHHNHLAIATHSGLLFFINIGL